MRVNLDCRSVALTICETPLHEGTPGRRRTAERYETAAADTAMYTAKTAGRDCVRHAENSINPTR